MNKLLRFFPHFLIFSYLIRLLVTGARFGDALVILVFGLIYGGHLYLDFIREPEVNKDIKDELKAIKESHEAVKSKVSSLSIANTFRK